MAERTALLLALAIVACRRPDRASPPPLEDAHPVAAPPAAPLPPCGPVFAADDVAPVGAGAADAPLTLHAACSDDALAVAWRAGAATGWAVHPLRDGTRWGAGTWDVPPSIRGGAVTVDRGALWSAVIGRDLALSLLRAPEASAPLRITAASVQAREWFDPQVLWADGARALVAITVRPSGSGREVWLLALGGGPAAWSPVGPGTLAATAAGPRALVTRVGVSADRAVTLRGQWVDARAALREMTAGRVALGAAALGVEASVPLPHTGIEFTPRASDDGAVLYQAVIGAERGAAGVAVFARDGAARAESLPMAPSALGDVVGEGDGYTLHWWDERYVPRRRTVRGARVTGESEGAPAAGSAFGALDAARVTRHLWCNGAPWVITAAGGSLRARREDCH